LKKDLSVEQQLEIIRLALEMGAKLNIAFHRIPSKQEAMEIAQQFAELMNCSYQVREDKQWINLDRLSSVDMTVFYKQSAEEKKLLLLAELAELEKGEQEHATN
jgi:hypothetical protein